MFRRHPLPVFFVLASLISWALWSPLWLPRLGVQAPHPTPFQHPLGAIGPIAAAFVVTALTEGRAGAARLLRGIVAWRGRTAWLFTATFGPLAVLAAAVAIARVAGQGDASFAGFGVSKEFPGLPVLGFFFYNVFTFGYGEETGWRGFALPRLQARHGAFTATFLLTIGWALWHAPLFLYRPGYSSMGAGAIAGWFFSLLTGAILLTWIFNGSRGSILAVALFHASIDVVFTSDVASAFVVNVAGAIITLLGIVVLLIAGPRRLSRSEKVIVEPIVRANRPPGGGAGEITPESPAPGAP